MGWRSTSFLWLSILLLAAFAAAFAQSGSSQGVEAAGTAVGPANARTVVVGDADRELVPKRGILENEAALPSVCARYVDAQMTYFRSRHNGGGVPAYAQKIRSTPGRRDGLFWALDSSGDESPVGPRFAAAAAAEDRLPGAARPYFGYFFKILFSQGPAAAGGARDYRVDGRLITGFALVAWPAEYGVSGVRSFIVNHSGDVYAKDLGPDTQRVAPGMSAFDPDRTWMKIVAGSDTK